MTKQQTQIGALIVFMLLAALHLQSTLSSGESSIYKVNKIGHYSWELLFDIDNRQNSGTVKKQIQTTYYANCSYRNIKKEIKTTSSVTSTGLEVGVGAIFKIVNIRMEGEINSRVRSMYEHLSEISSEIKIERTNTETYEIGPHSRLKMYRLFFNGPGIDYLTSTVSTIPHPMKDVHMHYALKLIPFLHYIEVVYTSDSVSRPSNIISEVNGKNPDINGGYGGSYVWLVAHWTTKLEFPASGIHIAIQRRENEYYNDLAQGAGGYYRYIKMQRNSYATDVITEISLYRTSQKEDDPRNGGRWQFKSEDINSKRGGDYLYLVWNKSSI
ncbi:unnamed protein product [Orchesella dallaii]|uniref:Uncharacterized protein n=1 Tax=Orchesella dallaii TaxID=48710 RepID=A0ABP1RIT1_9HEXA